MEKLSIAQKGGIGDFKAITTSMYYYNRGYKGY